MELFAAGAAGELIAIVAAFDNLDSREGVALGVSALAGSRREVDRHARVGGGIEGPVVPVPAVEQVRAGAALERVRPGAAVQRVVATATREHVVGVVAGQSVVELAAMDPLDALQPVALGVPVERPPPSSTLTPTLDNRYPATSRVFVLLLPERCPM